MPGVPREMQPMISVHIAPKIAAQAKAMVVSHTWSTTGWPESKLYAALESLIREHSEISVAFLPSELGVRLRFSAGGADAHAALERFVQQVRPKLDEALYAEDDTDLDVVVGRMLRDRQMTISVAESCTGGLLAKRLTDAAGASSYVVSGYVVYANRAKTELLGVDPLLIDEHGAVSEPVARAMADGALARSGTDCAIAITGIAGPDGGTPEKPVGLVWLAVAMKGSETLSRKIRLMGSREMIRARAAQAGLNMLRLRLLGSQ